MMPFAPKDDRGGPPEPGFYLVRMCKGGPWLPAQIIQQKGGDWVSVINGKRQGDPHPDPYRAPGVERIWHYGRRSDANEYAHKNTTREWAATAQPGHPLLHPNKPINLNGLPPVMPA